MEFFSDEAGRRSLDETSKKPAAPLNIKKARSEVGNTSAWETNSNRSDVDDISLPTDVEELLRLKRQSSKGSLSALSARDTPSASPRSTTSDVSSFTALSQSTSGTRLKNAMGKKERIVYMKKGDTCLIIAGTLHKLISLLADENVQDPEYLDVFLQTHSRFMSSATLFTKLAHRFKKYQKANSKVKNPQAVQIRLINVMKKWVRTNPTDFTNEKLRKVFEDFLDYLRTLDDEKGAQYARFLTQSLEGALQEQNDGVEEDLTLAPKPAIPKLASAKLLTVLDIDLAELARQMTLIDYKMFREIVASTLQKGVEKKEEVPFIKAIRDRANLITKWVTSEIVSCSNLKKRSSLLTNFIILIFRLLEVNNFHSALNVYLGIGSHPVQSQNDTWKSLSAKTVERWKSLALIMSPIGNFSKLRTQIASCKPPLLIPLSILFHDMLLNEEEHDYYRDESSEWEGSELINFEKFRRLRDILQDLNRCQAKPFNYCKVDIIHDYLTNYIKCLSDDELEAITDERTEKGEPKKKGSRKFLSINMSRTRDRSPTFS
jgi:hypothetical protein